MKGHLMRSETKKAPLLVGAVIAWGVAGLVAVLSLILSTQIESVQDVAHAQANAWVALFIALAGGAMLAVHLTRRRHEGAATKNSVRH